jgi:hypothetical protein
MGKGRIQETEYRRQPSEDRIRNDGIMERWKNGEIEQGRRNQRHHENTFRPVRLTLRAQGRRRGENTREEGEGCFRGE